MRAAQCDQTRWKGYPQLAAGKCEAQSDAGEGGEAEERDLLQVLHHQLAAGKCESWLQVTRLGGRVVRRGGRVILSWLLANVVSAAGKCDQTRWKGCQIRWKGYPWLAAGKCEGRLKSGQKGYDGSFPCWQNPD